VFEVCWLLRLHRCPIARPHAFSWRKMLPRGAGYIVVSAKYSQAIGVRPSGCLAITLV
jgi:hypothetical protein